MKNECLDLPVLITIDDLQEKMKTITTVDTNALGGGINDQPTEYLGENGITIIKDNKAHHFSWQEFRTLELFLGKNREAKSL